MKPIPVSRPSLLHLAAGTAGIALLLLAYYARTWRSFVRFNSVLDTCSEPFCDFARYYFPMGEAIFRTGQPVPGFVYSPFVAILLAAFDPLRLSTSLVLWGILQVLFIILYILLFRRLVPAGLPIQLLFVALALSSFPLLHTFKWGQVSVFMTVALLGVLHFNRRGQHVIAAALLTFAVSFKFFPLIFLAPFVARRDGRFLLWAAAVCVLFLVVVPVGFLGFDQTLQFYAELRIAYSNFGWVATSYNSQYFPHVIRRLAQIGGGHADAWLPLLRVAAWGVVVANLGLVYLIQRARLPRADLWSFVVLFLTIPFLLGTSWPVDLVFLPFVQALLVWALLDRNAAIGAWASPVGRALSGLPVLLSIVCSNVLLFNLIGDREIYGSLGFVFWADLLALAASYVLLGPAVVRAVRVRSA